MNPHQRAALLCLQNEAVPGRNKRLARYANDDIDGFMEFAERNRIAPIAAHAMADALGSPAPTAAWWEHHRKSENRMRILMEETDSLAAALAAQDIRMVALKNGGIARGLYPCAACCPMGDVDLLVSRSKFKEAHAITQACGFEFSSRSAVEPADLPHALTSGGGTEYVKRAGGQEIWFELQWRPIAGRWLPRHQEPDGDSLLARSVTIAGTDVRVLAPEDNMIQVALHTAKHSYVRAPGPRLHTDVDRLARYQPPNWDTVVATARTLQITTAVYFSLSLPHALLDTPIPMWVLETLRPPRWKRQWINQWIDHAGIFDPDDKKFNRVGMMIFHALLYDDFRQFAASGLDVDPSELSLKNLPRNLRSGMKRIRDIATRYQA